MKNLSVSFTGRKAAKPATGEGVSDHVSNGVTDQQLAVTDSPSKASGCTYVERVRGQNSLNCVKSGFDAETDYEGQVLSHDWNVRPQRDADGKPVLDKEGKRVMEYLSIIKVSVDGTVVPVACSVKKAKTLHQGQVVSLRSGSLYEPNDTISYLEMFLA